jgi:HlyD family secretion protein
VIKVNPEGIFKNDIATFEVTVAVEKPEGLMAGMNASVNVIVEEKTNTLYLPVAAVRINRGKAYVQVLENGQVVQKEVEVGVRTNDRYEILSGLNENDQVITAIVRPQSGPAVRTPFGQFGGGGQQGGQPGGNVPGGNGPGGGFQGGGFQGGGNGQQRNNNNRSNNGR